MKKSTIYICIAIGLTLTINSYSKKKQAMFSGVAVMQVNEPIPGVCNNSKIIAILPFPGNNQIEAKAPMAIEEITKLLNENVSYLKDKPSYNDKGMVSLIVNCKGQMVQCKIDNKTQSPELDAQIVEVLSKLEKWEAGSVNGESVDTVVLYSFTIVNGKISLD